MSEENHAQDPAKSIRGVPQRTAELLLRSPTATFDTRSVSELLCSAVEAVRCELLLFNGEDDLTAEVWEKSNGSFEQLDTDVTWAHEILSLFDNREEPSQLKVVHGNGSEKGLPSDSRWSITAPLVSYGVFIGAVRLSSDSDFPNEALSGRIRTLRMIIDMVSAAWHARTVEDTSERLQRELDRQALYDDITGLPNRRLLMDRLRSALHRSNRTKKAVGVLYVDLDWFKVINDTHGRDIGDQVIAEIGKRINKIVRATDTVCRYDSDEFVIVCEDINIADDCTKLAYRITMFIETPVTTDAGPISVGASVGVAFGLPDDDPEEVIIAADDAMFSAKSAGKGQVAVIPGALAALAD